MTPPARRRRPKQLPAVQVRNNRHRSVPDGASANVRPPAMAVDQGLHAFKVEPTIAATPCSTDQTSRRYGLRFPRSWPHVLGAQSQIEWNGKRYAIHGEPRIFQRLPSDGSRRLRDRP
jgi:hypothetical protein